MKTLILTIVLAVAFTAAGCTKSPSQDEIDPTGQGVSRGLAVTLTLPARSFVVGEQFEIALIAENTTDAPIEVDARSTSPYFLRVWRDTSIGWVQVKRYPQVDLTVLSPWTLGAGGRREFAGIKLEVEPDWPQGEMLRITAELNSRPDARAAVPIVIESASRDPAKEAEPQ